MTQMVEAYAQGAGMPAQAIAGLSRMDLFATPVPGTWSIQQIIVHLMDSDLVASDRMKRVIAEENPLLLGYNETLFATKLFYEKIDAAAAADLFARNRELTAVILRNLPETAFQRTGIHNEHGKLSLADLVVNYTNHLEHHLKFIRQKRQLLGK